MGGGPVPRVEEALSSIVPSAAIGELTDTDCSDDLALGEDILHCRNTQNKHPFVGRTLRLLRLDSRSAPLLQMSSQMLLESLDLLQKFPCAQTLNLYPTSYQKNPAEEPWTPSFKTVRQQQS